MKDAAPLFAQLKHLCIDVTEETYANCIQQGYAILIRLHDLEVMQSTGVIIGNLPPVCKKRLHQP